MFFCLIIINACTIGSNKNSQPLGTTAMGATLTDEIQLKKSYELYVTYFAPINIFPSDEYNQKIETLKKSFKDFSKGIGKNVLAIWTGESMNKFDSKISKDICDKYGLPYVNGSYILITKNDPIVNKEKQSNYIIISFANINPERIGATISDIEKKIRLDKHHQVDNIGVFEAQKQIVLSYKDNYQQYIIDIVTALINK
jgi:hypothetical protein